MADISAARQQVAGRLSSSSLYQDTANKPELNQPLERVFTTTQGTSEVVPSRRKFTSTQKPTRLTAVSNVIYEADGESSVEKRPMGDPGESGHKTKRQMQRRGINSGDKGEDGKGKGKAPPPDGPRYPPSGPTLRKRFECPFHKDSPDWYYMCKGKCMPRISDVTNHLKRRHLLLRVGIDLGRNTQPQDIVDYCPRCRIEFHGFGAAGRLQDHLGQENKCQEATIQQTGVMLLAEFEELKRELRSASDEVAKWFIIWRMCFLQIPPPSSPYVETIIPRTYTSGLSTVNCPMTGDGIEPIATRNHHTRSLLTMDEPHIEYPIQTRSEQPAPRPGHSTHAYPPFPDYGSAIPQTLSTFPSSFDNLYLATGSELIGNQNGQDFDASDEAYDFMNLDIHSSIAVPDAGNLGSTNSAPTGDSRYQDDFYPHWSGNDQGRSQN
ncbi:hypothetical protein ACHAPA_009657 [Fusarium lateritium]